MADVIETDYTTDPPTVVERDFTDAERAQIATDARAAAAALAAAKALETEQAAARQAAIDHAKSLGFTDAMIAVMYPNLEVADDDRWSKN
jgi:GAF domain-containing protein